MTRNLIYTDPDSLRTYCVGRVEALDRIVRSLPGFWRGELVDAAICGLVPDTLARRITGAWIARVRRRPHRQRGK